MRSIDTSDAREIAEGRGCRCRQVAPVAITGRGGGRIARAVARNIASSIAVLPAAASSIQEARSALSLSLLPPEISLTEEKTPPYVRSGAFPVNVYAQRMPFRRFGSEAVAAAAAAAAAAAKGKPRVYRGA